MGYRLYLIKKRGTPRPCVVGCPRGRGVPKLNDVSPSNTNFYIRFAVATILQGGHFLLCGRVVATMIETERIWNYRRLVAVGKKMAEECGLSRQAMWGIRSGWGGGSRHFEEYWGRVKEEFAELFPVGEKRHPGLVVAEFTKRRPFKGKTPEAVVEEIRRVGFEERQVEVAARYGVSQTLVSRIMAGER